MLVLIVEDDDGIREFLVQALTDEGHHVATEPRRGEAADALPEG